MNDNKHGVNTPIFPSVTFQRRDARSIADDFTSGIPRGTYLYQRFGHPNYEDLCIRLSNMEGGEHACVFASGIAATFALFFSQLSIGDHIVVSSRLYGGTRGQLSMLASKLKLRVSVVDVTDLGAVDKACKKHTKLFFAESVSNPEVVVTDIASIAEICQSKQRNILLCIDNTFTPLIVRPLTLGADVVMHSLTKYVNGRSDAMGGALIGSDEFIESLGHPTTGETSLIGGVLHPQVAQELAERCYQLENRVRESSQRAVLLAELFARAALRVLHPMLRSRLNEPTPSGLSGLTTPMGGGVLSIVFPTENEGVLFVNAVANEFVDDPILGSQPLAISAVSLGSSHTYVWCTTEARISGQMTKWKPLPFAPVPLGLVRVSVGYAGDFSLQLKHFEKVLRSLGRTVASNYELHH